MDGIQNRDACTSEKPAAAPICATNNVSPTEGLRRSIAVSRELKAALESTKVPPAAATQATIRAPAAKSAPAQSIPITRYMNRNKLKSSGSAFTSPAHGTKCKASTAKAQFMTDARTLAPGATNQTPIKTKKQSGFPLRPQSGLQLNVSHALGPWMKHVVEEVQPFRSIRAVFNNDVILVERRTDAIDNVSLNDDIYQ